MATPVIVTAECTIVPLVEPIASATPPSRADVDIEQPCKRRRLSITQSNAAGGASAAPNDVEATGGSDQPYAFPVSGSESSASSSSGSAVDHTLRESEELAHKEQVSTPSTAHTSTGLAAMSSPSEQPTAMDLLSATAVPEAGVGADQLPPGEPALALAPKRNYMCRTCGLGLSSASNRLRHERAKHKTPAPCSSASGVPAAATLPSSVQRTNTSSRYTPDASRPSSQFAWKASPTWSGDESEREDEVDLELEQFAAAAMPISSAYSRSVRPAFSTPAPTSEEEKSDNSPVDDAQMDSSSSDTSPSDDSSSSSPETATMPGMRPLLKDSDFQAGCQSFLRWLTQPPLTPCEVLVKGRSRVKSLTQLQPIKCNLKFIYSVLHEKEVTDTVDLQVLTRIDACQTLFDALDERRVGSVRLYALFLLIKKVLIHLSSCESTIRRQYLPPTLFESYSFVDSVCSDSGFRRKQESRNRALLGIQVSQQLLQDHRGQHTPRPFSIPAVWSASTASDRSPASAPATSTVTSSSASGPVAPACASPNEMTKVELQKVTKGCLTGLREFMAAPLSTNAATTSVRDRWFMSMLVTATLCLGLAPRSQILKQMRIGSSLTKNVDDGRYWVQMVAEMSKHGTKPVLFSLPAELTPIYDFYIDTVRPRLLAPASADHPATHSYVFLKANGTAPRADFSSCTKLITQQLLGRPVNPHAFRSAVVVGYYELSGPDGVSQNDMSVLANLMSHDVTTARKAYYRTDFSRAAVKANDRMTRFLLQAE